VSFSSRPNGRRGRTTRSAGCSRGISSHQDFRTRGYSRAVPVSRSASSKTYRFSEESRFHPFVTRAHLNEAFLARVFAEVAEWVYENSGLEMRGRGAALRDLHGILAVVPPAQGRVGYRGPLARGGDLPRIKLDLASDEGSGSRSRTPVTFTIRIPMSRRRASKSSATPSKRSLRRRFAALAERQRPRDLYDVIHLHGIRSSDANRNLVRTTLGRKCEFKNISRSKFWFSRPIGRRREEIEAGMGDDACSPASGVPAVRGFLD